MNMNWNDIYTDNFEDASVEASLLYHAWLIIEKPEPLFKLLTNSEKKELTEVWKSRYFHYGLEQKR